MRYESITTPDLKHDAENAITELIILNSDLFAEPYCWRKGKSHAATWGKTLSVIKKLTQEPFGLEVDQIAFYVYKCRPKKIDQKEFAKMAVVAQKLLQTMSLESLIDHYRKRKNELKPSISDGIKCSCEVTSGPRNLVDLIKEIEDEQKRKRGVA